MRRQSWVWSTEHSFDATAFGRAGAWRSPERYYRGSTVAGDWQAGLRWVQAVLARHGEAAPTLIQLMPTVEPYVYGVTVRSAEAIDAWHAIHETVPYSGYWPVLLGPPDDARWHAIYFEREAGRSPRSRYPSTAAQILAQSKEMTYGDWMVRRHTRLPDYARPEHDQLREAWPEDEQPRTALARGDGLEAMIGLFPTIEGWRCPAYWRWSVPNAYLSPADHCRVMRRWEREYGAELVEMKGQSVLQFRVTNPPRDRRGAMKLAAEHYLYCTDRVTQGTFTIERLAALLLDAPVWYFWFD